MKKVLIITTTVSALMIAGVALAQPHGMKAADANKDGNITRAELMVHLDKRFSKLDKNADGQITKEERKEARLSRQAKRFSKLDTDGNGSLSLEEFQAGNGKYHRADGKKYGHGKGGHAKHHARYSNPDANKDGVIDRAEFVARALKYFERVDANNDDVVSVDELKAAYANHKKHGFKHKSE